MATINIFCQRKACGCTRRGFSLGTVGISRGQKTGSPSIIQKGKKKSNSLYLLGCLFVSIGHGFSSCIVCWTCVRHAFIQGVHLHNLNFLRHCRDLFDSKNWNTLRYEKKRFKFSSWHMAQFFTPILDYLERCVAGSCMHLGISPIKSNTMGIPLKKKKKKEEAFECYRLHFISELTF